METSKTNHGHKSHQTNVSNIRNHSKQRKNKNKNHTKKVETLTKSLEQTFTHDQDKKNNLAKNTN